MNWRNDIPIFMQVIEQFKHDIILEKYQPDCKIKSVREFALELGINPNTVVKVYDILTKEGLIEVKSTNGYFLTKNIEKLNSLKSNFAEKYCKEFITNMQNIGYDLNETLGYLGEWKNGTRN